MRESVRNDIALRLPLQSIISNGRSGLHRRFNVARLDKPPFFFGAVCPNAGEAVRLQFDADLQTVGLHLVHPTLFLLHSRQKAELVLNVMADLMGNYICLGELAGFAANVTASKASLQILKKARVEIN